MAIRSMTGFGQGQAGDGRWRIAVGARSVNHRSFDLQVRLPEEWRPLEPGLRALATGVVARGRMELRVEIEPPAEAVHRLAVDRAGLAELAREIEALVEAGLVGEGLRAGDVLRAGDLVRVERQPATWGEAEQALLEAAAKAALGELAAGRAAEGQRLEAALRARLAGLGAQVERLAARREQARDEWAAGLRRRLQELLADNELPEDRLAFEVAVLVERSDVQEELDRLRAHLEHCGAVLDGGGEVGRRLDFLAQEMQRELNTLGAKCRDLPMTEATLEAKLICEQFREQVQNVE
jgi:uncharacterized protein (TIGR00255 family)